ncbi:DUF5054 domain-containing protein [Paenibacillus filicis]|uniref:DUF5054 domain-containing protein n=1 Tax=Paenibacillus gyeongsangnamensis TaxID=3388067 RepID=A0ABT4QJS7_9BACL|nr:DUF5054 domain-containing protein [Paenibacillus filicis]MCZ8517127.1 DUF5054 domain-containing protein [Paenibacillus filicis]
MPHKLEKIYVVFKTHFDIGFTGLASEVVQRYRTEMLDDVLDICKQTEANPPGERYVWTMSAWPLLQSLEGAESEARAQAEELIRSRRLIWHTLPYTTHTEFCGMEEWIRGMYVSRALSERYGYKPADAKMTDVPGHTWSVPSLLAKAGVKLLHLGCNPATTPPDVPPVFWWEGPDGARLLTFYSKGSYGTGILPPEDWEHPVWLAMIQTSDNHGPHSASIIEEMKASITESGQETELHIGSLGDFAEDFLSRRPELPVIRGDLADSWIHGVSTAPREVSLARAMRGRAAVVESALALGELKGELGDFAAAKKLMASCYERLLLFGEHTWGMDCKTFLFPRRYEKKAFLEDKTSERYLRMEQSWQEQRDYLTTAGQAMEDALSSMKAGLRLGAEPGELSHGNPRARAFRVYNRLGWKRNARVWIEAEPIPAGLAVKGTGEPVRLTLGEGGVWAEVRELPALGFITLIETERNPALDAVEESIKAVAPALQAYMNETEAVLENGRLRIEVCRTTGRLLSLRDKLLNKEFVDDRSPYAFGQYEYNVYSNEEITRYLKKYAYRFYDWGVHDFGKTGYPEGQKRQMFTPGEPVVRVETDEAGARIVCVYKTDDTSVKDYGNAREVIWSVSLAAGADYADLELRLGGKEETPLAESGSLVFPLKLNGAKYRINKMGSVVDPLVDLVRSSSTLLNCCEHFVDVMDKEGGMAVIPLDTPLLSIGRNGMWDFEHEYKPEKPELHFNLFNNQWGTNFPQWTGGDFRFRYRLMPHAGGWSEAEVWRRAEETMSVPLIMPAAAGAAVSRTELLPEGLDGAAVVSFKPAEDGDGFILRLRDWFGRARELALTFPAEVAGVTVTDLLEADRGTLSWTAPNETGNRQVGLLTQPFEVHTLRLRFR